MNECETLWYDLQQQTEVYEMSMNELEPLRSLYTIFTSMDN